MFLCIVQNTDTKMLHMTKSFIFEVENLFVCGTVLKRHNMFWSSTGRRWNKEQSVMSFFLRYSLSTPSLICIYPHTGRPGP